MMTTTIVRYSKKRVFYLLGDRLCRDLSFDETNAQQTDGQKHEHLLQVANAWAATIGSDILIVGVF
jgi:hypothetical protein